jgi:Acetyltransferase (GNAT) family
MLEPKVVVAQSETDFEKCFPVMYQLRPHLTLEKFKAQVKEQIFSAGYNLIFLENENQVVSALGYRVTYFLAWGKVLYIDDLITDSLQINNGYAGKLIDWVFGKAKELECDQIHLASGYQRHAAHKLYLNKGMKIGCHHFYKEV